MKKITQLCGLVFLGITAFSNYSNAQITITTADMPTAGLNVITEKDSTTALLPGNPSATTQAWNFSTLKRQKAAHIKFMAESATPYASSFPLANLADTTLGVNNYDFFINNSTEFAVEGVEEIIPYKVGSFTVTFQVKINLNPVFVQSNLPATYNDKCNGVSRGHQTLSQTVAIYDSEKISTNITYFDTVDAFGTMTMPNGTVYQVLRQNHHEVDVDSVSEYSSITSSWSSPSVTSTTYHQYFWYTNGAGYILVEMNVNPSTGALMNTVWDTTAPTGINEVSEYSKVSVYPNPASTQVNFQTIGINDMQFVKVYDMAGRELTTLTMKNGLATLNTSTFASGIYLYTLSDKDGNVIDRGKFSVK